MASAPTTCTGARSSTMPAWVQRFEIAKITSPSRYRSVGCPPSSTRVSRLGTSASASSTTSQPSDDMRAG